MNNAAGSMDESQKTMAGSIWKSILVAVVAGGVSSLLTGWLAIPAMVASHETTLKDHAALHQAHQKSFTMLHERGTARSAERLSTEERDMVEAKARLTKLEIALAQQGELVIRTSQDVSWIRNHIEREKR